MNTLVTARRYPAYPASPLASLLNLSRDFDRLLDSTWAAGANGENSVSFTPVAELRDGKEAVTVSLELPGVSRKDVSITYHDGVLTVSGERRQESEIREGETLRTERHYGRFERLVEIATPVDADKVSAAFKDGVLIVTLPKRADARPKQIDISAN
jgi:HSP20 family protein